MKNKLLNTGKILLGYIWLIIKVLFIIFIKPVIKLVKWTINGIKIAKEELILLPILIIGLGMANYFLSMFFPLSNFFDLPSEAENFVKRLYDKVYNISLAWIMLRVMLPGVFKWIRDEYYKGFNKLDDKTKYILATVLLSTFVISANAEESQRTRLVNNLIEQMNVREVTANSSPMIDKYLSSVGLKPGYAWCAAFVSYNLNLIGVENPMSAWSPNFALEKDIIWQPKTGYKTKGDVAKAGDVVTFYYSRLNRVGHVGFYIKTDKSGYAITIEGNTNNSGSRNGDGVYMKKRSFNKIHAISRYIKEV